MKKLNNGCISTSKRLLITALVVAGAIGHNFAMAQTCMPLITKPFTVKGIVAGTAVTGGMGTSNCPSDAAGPSDAGWVGVVAQNFSVFGTPGGMLSANIFLAGYNATTDAVLDKIYLGVHVQGDPELRNLDRLIFYFDVDGGGGSSWAPADFALAYEVGPDPLTTTPPGDESCDHSPGSEQFYRYSGGSWMPQTMPAGFTRKVAWDYIGPPDSETGIWEFEIEIDVSSLSLAAPSSGPGFRVGAKLFIHQLGAGTTVWRWPSGLTTQALALFDPNDSNVTPATLEQTTAGACDYDVAFDPDPTSGVTATSNAGTSNEFTRLTNSDFDGQTPLKQNHFRARVIFRNPSNLMDNSPVAVPNVGQVKFFIKPYNGGFLGEYLMGQRTISFNQLSQSITVPQFDQLDWPQTRNQYDDPVTHQPMNHLAASGHACLKVELSGFAMNSDATNDLSSRNLTYISTSTVRDTFLVSTIGVEPPPGANTLDYILRVDWQNIPPDIIKGWNYRFTNAERIGLRDLGNGYFSMSMNIGEEKLVAIEIAGGEMPVAPNQYLLSPRAGGTLLPKPSGEPPLDLVVQPGKMMTIITHGLINVDPQNDRIRENDPNGFSDSTWSYARFLLPSDYHGPSQNIGALIGSFDNFKTAFVIGADMTFLVPEGASQLSLAINDTSGAYDNNRGKGFELNVVITEPLFLPTRLAASGNPSAGQPARPRVGSNLPEFDIDVYQAIAFPEQRDKLLQPTGYVAYAVYASHPRQGGDECACGSASAASLAFSSFVAILGLAVIYRNISRKTKDHHAKQS